MRIVERKAAVEISGNDPDLRGTVFDGQEFRIWVRPMNRVEIARVRSRVPLRGRRADDTEVQVELCIEAIERWEGIENEAGEPLPCTDAGKRFLLNECTELASVIMLRATESQVARDQQEAAEIKNSRSSTGGS